MRTPSNTGTQTEQWCSEPCYMYVDTRMTSLHTEAATTPTFNSTKLKYCLLYRRTTSDVGQLWLEKGNVKGGAMAVRTDYLSTCSANYRLHVEGMAAFYCTITMLQWSIG